MQRRCPAEGHEVGNMQERATLVPECPVIQNHAGIRQVAALVVDFDACPAWLTCKWPIGTLLIAMRSTSFTAVQILQ